MKLRSRLGATIGAVVGVGLAAAVVAVAVPTAPAPNAGTTITVTPAAAPSGPDLAALAKIAIKGRAPQTGYSRDQFGPSWFDVDRNGCDTRNDILRRDLTNVTLKPGVSGCSKLAVGTGTLQDPYTGKTISFVRGTCTAGQTTGCSDAVQIDHVVPLSDAWQKGAQQLTADQRLAFANDPMNLLAVDGRTNQAKGDSDAATWLPPNRGEWCAYVARQVLVKITYKLWMTQAEHDAIARIEQGCP